MAAEETEHPLLQRPDVHGVAAHPESVPVASAPDEGGLLDGVGPDDVEGRTPVKDRAGGIAGDGPDEVRVVFKEGVDAEQRARGTGAEEVDAAVLHTHRETVGRTPGSKFLEILGEVRLRVCGAEKDLCILLLRRRKQDREIGASDLLNPMAEVIGRETRHGHLKAAGAAELEVHLVLREEVVDTDSLGQVHDDLGKRLAVLCDADGLVDTPRLRREKLGGGVAVVGLVVRHEVGPLGVALRLSKDRVRALDQLREGNGHDDLPPLRDLARVVVEAKSAGAVADEALVARVIVVLHVPPEVREPVFAARFREVVVAEVRGGHAERGPLEVAVIDSHAEVVEIAVEGAGGIAGHNLSGIADDRLEVFRHFDLGDK